MCTVYTDFHQGLSAGTCVSFGVDSASPPYENENGGYFALSFITWPILYFIAWRFTTETNYLQEGNVVVPVHVREEMGVEGENVEEAVDPTVQRTSMEKEGKATVV